MRNDLGGGLNQHRYLRSCRETLGRIDLEFEQAAVVYGGEHHPVELPERAFGTKLDDDRVDLHDAHVSGVVAVTVRIGI